MPHTQLRTTIETLWERRDALNAHTEGADRDAVETALDLLDKGSCALHRPKTAAGSFMNG